MTSTAVGTSIWSIDPVHSVAEFSAKHMMVSNVKGRFRKLEGKIYADEGDPARSRVEATIDATSIDTADPQRDAHLRSPDFFDVERYPTISFHSKRVEKIDDERSRVIGDLTIHGVTREAALEVEYEGQIKDAYGKQRAAFTATTELNRKDFGLNWNSVIETGGVVVGDKVKVTLEIAAVKSE